MANSKAAIQILLSLNLLFFAFTVVSSTCVPSCSTPPKCHKSPCSTPPTPPKCHKSPCSTPPKRHKCPPPVPQPQPQPPSTAPKQPQPPSKGHKSPCSTPPVPQPQPQPPSTAPKQPQPPSTSTKQPSCPKDTLKLGVCADLLGLVHVQIGKNTPCCSLIQGLADLDAAVCLCTALKANVLGINLNIPINLALLLNLCGKNVPKGFVCG